MRTVNTPRISLAAVHPSFPLLPPCQLCRDMECILDAGQVEIGSHRRIAPAVKAPILVGGPSVDFFLEWLWYVVNVSSGKKERQYVMVKGRDVN